MKGIDWIHEEKYSSPLGTVTRDKVAGEWVGRVNLPDGKVGRLKETFVSAVVAIKEVEHRWEKENRHD